MNKSSCRIYKNKKTLVINNKTPNSQKYNIVSLYYHFTDVEIILQHRNIVLN